MLEFLEGCVRTWKLERKAFLKKLNFGQNTILFLREVTILKTTMLLLLCLL